MIQKMKLGTKLTMGFMVLLAIAMGLGGLAIWEMNSVKKTATALAAERVPEVEVAYAIERYAYNTMFEIRGYAYNDDESFLKKGKESLAQVKKYLQDGKALGASSPNLAKLAEMVAEIDTHVEEYEKLLDQSVSDTKGLEAERKSAEAAAAKYMEMCYQVLTHQNESLNKLIAEGKEATALNDRLKKISFVNDLIDIGNWIVTGTWKAQFKRDTAMLSETDKYFEKVYPKLDELKAMTTQEVNLKEIETIREAAKTYQANMNKFLAIWNEREELMKKRNTIAHEILSDTSETVKRGMDETGHGAKESAEALGRASTITIYGQFIALAAGLLLAYFLTRSITRPIFRIIAGLTDGSQEVSSAAGQVSSAAQSLAEGSSEQAASIEETSSSLEEMSSMTRRNADNAQQANSLTNEAKVLVQDANGSMSQLSQSMGEISQASEETSKIIKTIDEIAFQTNLLALNAAVEAARAGEAGAGFAVVADEVRSLAMRAADAAKNTANLIEGTMKKVKDGSDLVTRSNDAFQKVAVSAGKVADLVSEISAASNEQAKGIGQINVAVTELDKLTQQNAANAEESASAAEEMSAQAETMLSNVGELVSMVGSGAKQNLGNRAGKTKLPKAASHPPARLTAKAAQKEQALIPEEIIPLDGKDFADL